MNRFFQVGGEYGDVYVCVSVHQEVTSTGGFKDQVARTFHLLDGSQPLSLDSGSINKCHADKDEDCVGFSNSLLTNDDPTVAET